MMYKVLILCNTAHISYVVHLQRLYSMVIVRVQLGLLVATTPKIQLNERDRTK